MQNIFTKKQVRLHTGEVMSLRVNRPVCLLVGSGRVWVTIEGARTDYWLCAGQSLDIPGRSLVVIESVHAASKLQVGLCRRHWISRVQAVLHAAANRWRGRRDAVADASGS